MKRHASFTCGILFAFYAAALAQDPPKEEPKEVFGWKNDLVGGLNLTQNRYSSNWTKGGENSLAWKGGLDVLAENNATKTQFANGYIYGATPAAIDTAVKVSSFFSPAFLRQSLGLGYKPSESFMTRFGLSVKENIVLDDGFITLPDRSLTTFRGYHGNKGNEEVRVETGLESVTDVKLKLQENLLFTSKLELFTSFERIDAVDTIWDNMLIAKISKYLSASLNVYMFYDEDILPEVQVRQAMAFGLTYTFF